MRQLGRTVDEVGAERDTSDLVIEINSRLFCQATDKVRNQATDCFAAHLAGDRCLLSIRPRNDCSPASRERRTVVIKEPRYDLRLAGLLVTQTWVLDDEESRE